MSKGKDEAFEKAYASVVENGWTNVKHMARQVWDMASATPPAAQVQGEQPEVVGHLLLCAAFSVEEMGDIDAEWDFKVAERLQRELATAEDVSLPLMTVAQHERIVAALSADNQRLVPPGPILAKPHPMAAVQGEREAYEEYMRPRLKRLGWGRVDFFARGDNPETYANQYSQSGWEMWQAATLSAALSAPPAAGVPEDSRAAIPADVLRDIGTMLDDAMAAPYPNSMAVPDHLVNVAYWMTYGRSGYAPASPAVGVHFDDQRGEFRAWFEGWVLETEHPGLGWLGEHSLDQGDTPNSYADQYVHGAWVMAMHLSVEIKRAQFHSHLHLQRAKLAESTAPTPPASEQQQAVVLPERLTFEPDNPCGFNEIWVNSRNATIDELLRLNPHLAGVNQGITTEAGNGGEV